MGDSTTCSTINRASDSTYWDKDKIFEKINEATIWVHLLKAHIAFLRAKITNERKSNKANKSDFGDCTVINETFYYKVSRLWIAVHNYKITVQNETNKLFNVLVPDVMGNPLKNNEMEVFRRLIIELGEHITPIQILQLEVTEDKEKLEIELMEKQKEMATLIAEVGDKMEQAESRTHPREIQRRNLQLMKIKICRCVINSLLVWSPIDFEENPELVDLKIKWRQPISLESK